MYNVLIADDEPAICEGMCSIIDWNKYGFNVIDTASDGEEALEKLKSGRYSLVVTDIRMPVMDGLELIKSLRRQNSYVKILILSGYNDFNYAKKAIDYGVNGYLLKPIDRDELMEYLQAVRKELDKELESSKSNSLILKNVSGITDECSTIEQFQQLLASTCKEACDILVQLQKDKRPSIISQIEKYIEQHYSEDLTLKSIASIFYINPIYLGRLFKNSTGDSFSDYVNKTRISKAKKMLLAEDMKICELIKRLGYNNQEYFYRVFRKYEGMAFADYKETLKKYKR